MMGTYRLVGRDPNDEIQVVNIEGNDGDVRVAVESRFDLGWLSATVFEVHDNSLVRAVGSIDLEADTGERSWWVDMTRHPAAEPSPEMRVAASHVLGVLAGDINIGIRPGGFTTALIEAATHADPINLSKLGQGFPEIAHCVRVYKKHIDGVNVLRRLAAG